VPKQIIRFNITPQTNIRTVQADKWFFRIPREKLHKPGLQRLVRIERYNDYKLSLKALAKQNCFTFPNQGVWVRFYIPCPPSWSEKKKKLYHGKLHMSRCDLDNYLKALFDGLFSEDKSIGHYQASKQWVNFPTGWIEFEIGDPVFPEVTPPQVKE
jgi:Holliday junction resolvase RusA-like endonuclease